MSTTRNQWINIRKEILRQYSQSMKEAEINRSSSVPAKAFISISRTCVVTPSSPHHEASSSSPSSTFPFSSSNNSTTFPTPSTIKYSSSHTTSHVQIPGASVFYSSSSTEDAFAALDEQLKSFTPLLLASSSRHDDRIIISSMPEASSSSSSASASTTHLLPTLKQEKSLSDVSSRTINHTGSTVPFASHSIHALRKQQNEKKTIQEYQEWEFSLGL